MKYAVLLLLAGCIDPIDPAWTLDHDRVVVARATPPRIHPGDTTNLDALVAHAGGPTTIESPLDAKIATSGVAAEVRRTDSGWVLATSPTTAYANEPAMPVDVIMSFAHGTDRALSPMQVKKTVWIGEPAMNPAMPPITVDGAPAGSEVVVAKDTDVYLSTAVPSGWRVNWLTSAGTLHQDDEPTSFIHIAPGDRQSGELACVIRDDEGGVAWQVWPLRAR